MRKRRLSKALAMFLAAALTIPVAVPVAASESTADKEECRSIADLGVDFLAAGIGNIHGKYPANWEGLDFD